MTFEMEEQPRQNIHSSSSHYGSFVGSARCWKDTVCDQLEVPLG
jgi:hypothetical protein